MKCLKPLCVEPQTSLIAQEVKTKPYQAKFHTAAATVILTRCVRGSGEEGTIDTGLFRTGRTVHRRPLRRGLLEEASGGTFFLDEVGDLAPVAQAKLLWALQEEEIRRVGGNETAAVDLRIIAASRRNLSQMVKAGQFREDLLYRLNTVMITLPPLRERPEDIPVLAEFFLSRYGADKDVSVTSFAPTAMQALVKYAWPGNARELEHVIERAVALASHSILSLDDLSDEVKGKKPDGDATLQDLPGTLSALQRDRVLAVLESTHGNKERAARLLGISRRTLYRLLDRYAIHHPSPGSDSSDVISP